jgi:hypothetical protein
MTRKEVESQNPPPGAIPPTNPTQPFHLADFLIPAGAAASTAASADASADADDDADHTEDNEHRNDNHHRK